MPWKPNDARGHTKKADSPKKQRQWSDVANAVLAKTGNEGRAVRAANAVVARARGKGGAGGTLARSRGRMNP